MEEENKEHQVLARRRLYCMLQVLHLILKKGVKPSYLKQVQELLRKVMDNYAAMLTPEAIGDDAAYYEEVNISETAKKMSIERISKIQIEVMDEPLQLQKEIEKLTQQLATAQTTISVKDDKIKSYEHDVEKLNAQMTERERDVAPYEGEDIETLKKENETLKKENETLTSNALEMDTKVAGLEEEIAAAQSTIDIARNELEEARQQLAELREQLDEDEQEEEEEVSNGEQEEEEDVDLGVPDGHDQDRQRLFETSRDCGVCLSMGRVRKRKDEPRQPNHLFTSKCGCRHEDCAERPVCEQCWVDYGHDGWS